MAQSFPARKRFTARPSATIRGSSACCRSATVGGGRYYDRVGTIEWSHDWKEQEDRRARRPKTWLGKLWRTFRPLPHYQLYSKEPHYSQGFNAEIGGWYLQELSVEDLAALMSRYWVEYVWEWRLSRRLTFQDLVDHDFSYEPTRLKSSILCALYNQLAGRREMSLGHIREMIRRGEMTIAEIRKEMEASPPTALLEYSEDDPEREARLLKICKSHRRHNERAAMQARRLAAALDLEV